ncbi:WhiB family transcriptional regulator [Streptomyces sp. NPDC058001]|uniref:WhiB family transcriptional regulator n=1 Tax=Streptomyces sp. NPDC058001 TaxID=3346300 RepID=UPI0036E88A6F
MGWVTDWSAQAACRTTDPDELFVQGAAQNRAKAVCTGCPVRTECLADALDNRVEFGVWGGMTERERRALLRRRPTVTSWRNLLETARSEYERGTGLLPVNIDAIGEIDDIHDMHDIDDVDNMDDEETYESYAAVG